jgi:hypothetical protein
MIFNRYYMHRGLLCTKKKLESIALHEVVPHAPLEQPTSLAESLLRQRAYMR